MPKIIVTSRYLKAGSHASLGNYVRYIGTREGVEKVTRMDSLAPTEKQRETIDNLLKQFPESGTLREYKDYQDKPTLKSASECISSIVDSNMELLSNREIYMNYLGTRPNVVKRGSNGLFSDSDGEIVLDRAAKEVANHNGNVWTHVVSLRRDDAERMGFTTLNMWRDLVRRHICDIAAAQKISFSNIRWYAAFHNKETNPHVHIVVYSSDTNEGYLTKQGIEKIRSAFANDIYRDELQNLYQEQTVVRNMLREEAAEQMKALAESIKGGGCNDTELINLLARLSGQMKSYKGKKVYGYLPKGIKATVDSIVARLAANPNIAKMYDNWCRLEQEKFETYSGAVKTFPPLESNDVFKPIRNMVISTVNEMNFEVPTAEMDMEEDEPKIVVPNFNRRKPSVRVPRDPVPQDIIPLPPTANDETAPSVPITTPTDTIVRTSRAIPDNAQKRAERCAVRLLCELSKLLSSDFCQRQQSERAAVDIKLRRLTREKKQALGAKDEPTMDIEY